MRTRGPLRNNAITSLARQTAAIPKRFDMEKRLYAIWSLLLLKAVSAADHREALKLALDEYVAEHPHGFPMSDFAPRIAIATAGVPEWWHIDTDLAIRVFGLRHHVIR